MKHFIFPGIVIVLLATTWALYLEHGNRRFVKRLPKISVERDTQDFNTKDAPSFHENPETISSLEQEGYPEILADTNNRKSEASQVLTPIPIDRPESAAETPQERISEDDRQPYQIDADPPPTPKINIFEMFPEEMRRFYVEKHGDSPEIQTIADYFHSFMDGEPLTGNEMLQFLEAVNVAFPSPENQDTYERILRRHQETEVRNKALQNDPHMDKQ